MNTPFLEQDFDPTRRTLLKVGIAGSALLFAGRWLASPSEAAETSSTPAAALTYLTAADVVVLGRIVPVMLHGALPQDDAQQRVAIGEIISGVDTTIGFQPPAVRQEIKDLFGLLTTGATRVVVAGIWKSWDKASTEDVWGFLDKWRNSRFDLLRSAYLGLNNLIVGSWYGNPKSWSPIGYGGAPKIV
jgi:hypothetical protein